MRPASYSSSERGRELLRSAQQNSNITQETWVGNGEDFSDSTLKRLLSGSQPVSEKTIKKICIAVGIPEAEWKTVVIDKDASNQELLELSLDENTEIASHWRAAYDLVKPPHFLESCPGSFSDALPKVQQMGDRNQDHEAIAQFIAYFTLDHISLSTELQDQLKGWLAGRVSDVEKIRQVVEEKSKNSPGLNPPQPQLTEPRLMLMVTAESESNGTTIEKIDAYLVLDRNRYDPLQVSPEGIIPLKDWVEFFATEGKGERLDDTTTLARILQVSLDESFRVLAWNQDGYPPLQVELFLPTSRLCMAVDQWPADETHSEYFEPVGSRYRVVLRMAERLGQCKEQKQGNWRTKWQQLQTEQPSVLICGNDEPQKLRLAPGRVLGWHRKQPPTECSDLRTCSHFSVLVDNGAFIAIWLRDSSFEGSADFSKLCSTMSTDIPLRIQRLRNAAFNDENPEIPHLGRHLSLIWEDPKTIPPSPRELPRLGRMSA